MPALALYIRDQKTKFDSRYTSEMVGSSAGYFCLNIGEILRNSIFQVTGPEKITDASDSHDVSCWRIICWAVQPLSDNSGVSRRRKNLGFPPHIGGK